MAAAKAGPFSPHRAALCCGHDTHCLADPEPQGLGPFRLPGPEELSEQ